jgi:K+-transporting ATPase ATPase C chain
MNEADRPNPEDQGAGPASGPLAPLRDHVRPALLGVLLLTLLTGMVFPLALAVLARPLFRFQADGSLLSPDGIVVGSELIAQGFSGPGYFHPRPSAAGDGYDPTASGGTNLGPTNPRLREDVRKRVDEYRRLNELPPHVPVPVDAVTCSGSGLDPHISPADAALQVGRVARARNRGEDVIRRLVAEHTRGRQLGFLGEPRVHVLALNLALDRIAPLAPVPE